MPAEGVVSGNPAGVGGGVPQFGGAVGMQSGGGASDVRSCAYAVERAAEIFGVERDGLHQGEERDSYRAGICWATAEFCRPAFLGTGLLGINGRQERGSRASVHPRPRERRQTPRTTGTGGAFERLPFLTALSGSRYLKPPALPEVADCFGYESSEENQLPRNLFAHM